MDEVMAGRLVAMVKMAVEDWADEELFTMNLAAQLGADPRGTTGYDKAVKARLIDPGSGRFGPEIAFGLARAVEARQSGT